MTDKEAQANLALLDEGTKAALLAHLEAALAEDEHPTLEMKVTLTVGSKEYASSPDIRG